MRQPPFHEQEVYHVYNRGTDRRDIFLDDNDYARFLDRLILFNDANSGGRDNRTRSAEGPAARPYVNIIAFALMPNHFHLLLEPVVDAGVSDLMHRLGTGYTMYFNKRHHRTGRLFEMTYKALHVGDDGYFDHLTRYIHLNPLELTEPDWKAVGVRNPDHAVNALAKYPWSSAGHYLGKDRLDFIASSSVEARFPNPGDYLAYVKAWIPSKVGRLNLGGLTSHSPAGAAA